MVCFCFLLTGSCKKHVISPIPISFYSAEFNVSSTNYNDDLYKKCFISLHGGIVPPSSVNDGQDDFDTPYSYIDLGYNGPDRAITAPGSSYGLSVFQYFYDWENVSKWPVANKGSFSATNLSQADFDNLHDITAFYPIIKNCNNESGYIGNAGSVVAFNLDNWYGLIYVVNSSGDNADIKVKYVHY